MKKIITVILFTGMAFFATAQVKVGVMGGANMSTIVETNNLTNWSTIKKNYKWLQGYQGGVVSEIPLNKKATFVLQPAVMYFNKGRKYFQQFDTTGAQLKKDSSFKQKLNYIEIPLNLLLKFHLGKKVNFVIGGGPYAAFFFGGKESSVTHFKDPSLHPIITASNTDLPVGNGPGKYTTLDYGVTATAGFEVGKFFVRATGSQSLADMYQASNYKGSFKNQVVSVSLGVWLANLKPTQEKKKVMDTTATPPKKIKDKDGDGVADKDDKCPNDAGTAATMGCPDRDGDGVADKDDRCPDAKGDATNHGCPVATVDTDGDGVPDTEDKCPTVKGTAQNNGCPAVNGDSDGDGVNDDVDQCPTVAGLLRYHGCPIPDTDGDGVNDEIDHCKDVPGLKTNHGCPEKTTTVTPETDNITDEMVTTVTETAKKILFKQSQFDLSPAAMTALNAVADLLQRSPSLRLQIDGHASKEGEHYVNLGLSNSRANAVKDYLASKGINEARLHIAYFGDSMPLTTDPAKQEMNRRVEMKLY